MATADQKEVTRERNEKTKMAWDNYTNQKIQIPVD